MIRLVETPFKDLVTIETPIPYIDEQGQEQTSYKIEELEVLKYTIIEKFEDLEDGTSLSLQTTRLMPNGDYYILSEADGANVEQFVPFQGGK